MIEDVSVPAVTFILPLNFPLYSEFSTLVEVTDQGVNLLICASCYSIRTNHDAHPLPLKRTLEAMRNTLFLTVFISAYF